MGEYELAVEHLEECLKLLEQIPQGFFSIEGAIGNLISYAVEYGDNERAQKYFHRLENIYKQKKNKNIEILYKFAKAQMLKTSSRIRDKARAEALFKEVIEVDSFWFEITLVSHIHLCDILLMEYRIENNIEVLNELNYYLSRLLDIAEKQHSYLVFCEAFVLRAKLALINLDVKSARQFLTQAQKIAESNGINRLAMKISYEHDELIKQIKVWEMLKESEASLSERFELAGLTKQIESMLRRRVIEVPELLDEEPVLLLIISEGGIPFFSQSFSVEKSFESHLFGGFLSTIDYFINEVFSEGLDRAVFGEHTLLMKSVTPFFITYIFKGQSYYALQKMNKFIEKLQKNEDTWKKLLRYFQANQSIELNEVPLLESLISEIFIIKTREYS